MTEAAEALRGVALGFPEAQAGISCRGTSLERPTATVRKKAFLFIGPADVRFKLGESLPEASRLAAERPDVYTVGSQGWVSVRLDGGQPPDNVLLRSWIEESYRLMAPKQLAANLPKS